MRNITKVFRGSGPKTRADIFTVDEEVVAINLDGVGAKNAL